MVIRFGTIQDADDLDQLVREHIELRSLFENDKKVVGAFGGSYEGLKSFVLGRLHLEQSNGHEPWFTEVDLMLDYRDLRRVYGIQPGTEGSKYDLLIKDAERSQTGDRLIDCPGGAVIAGSRWFYYEGNARARANIDLEEYIVPVLGVRPKVEKGFRGDFRMAIEREAGIFRNHSMNPTNSPHLPAQWLYRTEAANKVVNGIQYNKL